MKVDSHLHVNFKNLGIKDIISYMDKERIDQCWLLTWEESRPLNPGYQPLPVEDVFDAYEKFGQRIRPLYAPDPCRPDAVESFMHWHEKGACGCGELKVALRWDSDRLDPILSCVDELGLPLVFHMEDGGYVYVADNPSMRSRVVTRLLNTSRLNGLTKKVLESVARRYGPLKEMAEGMGRVFPGYLLDFASLDMRLKQYRNISFIGHGPLFWKGIFPDPGMSGISGGDLNGEGIMCRLLSEHDNLYVDLSASGHHALARDPVFARKFLSRFGHKILYGTDNFFNGLKPFLESMKLSERTYKQIYGENACKLMDRAATPQAGSRLEGHATGREHYGNAVAN